MFNKSLLIISFALSLTLILAACGGSSSSDDPDDPPDTANGQFKDSNVSGLSYVSGDESDNTNSEGYFTYEVGKSIRFSVGNITIGEIEGKSIITPADLGGGPGGTKTLNIVRFLMFLDDDGDASNGISITQNVRDLAETDSWTQVNFDADADDFSSQMHTIMTTLNNEREESRTLTSTTDANNHLLSTIRCMYSGGYVGTFTSTTHGVGNFGFRASGRGVRGYAYIDGQETYRIRRASNTIGIEQVPTFVSWDRHSDASTISGTFTSLDALSGVWNTVRGEVADSGSFSGLRIGGDRDARYRVSTQYVSGTGAGDDFRADGKDFGLILLDINESDEVTGVLYSVKDNGDGEEDEREVDTLTGTLSGNRIVATLTDEDEAATFTATIDSESGDVDGNWIWEDDEDDDDMLGTFRGGICKLN